MGAAGPGLHGSSTGGAKFARIGKPVTATLYQRFDAPGVAALDRFEHWRAWYSRAIDVPTQLELVDEVPPDFDASAEALGHAAAVGLACADGGEGAGRACTRLFLPQQASAPSFLSAQPWKLPALTAVKRFEPERAAAGARAPAGARAR